MSNQDEDHRQEQAFLALLRHVQHGETPDPYATTAPGRSSARTDTHPNRSWTRHGRITTAAGAYGITKQTYDEALAKGVAHDFSPDSQDRIALWRCRQSGVIASIWAGELDAAFAHLNREWPALPGGSQERLTPEQARDYVAAKLGQQG